METCLVVLVTFSFSRLLQVITHYHSTSLALYVIPTTIVTSISFSVPGKSTLRFVVLDMPVVSIPWFARHSRPCWVPNPRPGVYAINRIFALQMNTNTDAHHNKEGVCEGVFHETVRKL